MSIGLNSDLEVADRKLHLQTSVEDQQIIASLFDGGVLIFKKRFALERQEASEALENKISRVHELVKADVEMLFHIAEKVRNSKHLPSMRRLGHLFFDKGFYADAVEQLSEVIKSQPDDEELEIELATALLLSGNAQSALRYAEKAAEKKPDYPDFQLLLAKINWRLKRFDESRERIYRALSLNPQYWDAYFYTRRSISRKCRNGSGSCQFTSSDRTTQGSRAAIAQSTENEFRASCRQACQSDRKSQAWR